MSVESAREGLAHTRVYNLRNGGHVIGLGDTTDHLLDRHGLVTSVALLLVVVKPLSSLCPGLVLLLLAVVLL